MTVLKKLKLYNNSCKAKNAIINNALAQKEELIEVNIQELEYKYPAFVIR